ncbi:MAG: hypothetical protein K9J13_17180 [Saprospiraceae bacterium]|nr:hypothetical protein [Saprospiraceae bacterium]
MKNKYLSILIFIFLSGVINAQTDFRPGYIIKLEGDTVFGEIDYRGDQLMCELCKFRLSEQAEETTYFPKDIFAYRFTDSKYFISKQIKGKKVFLEFLINGQIDIYYLRDEKGDYYFIEKEGEELIELPYEEVISRTKDGIRFVNKSKKHIGILSVYMQDAIDFQNRISKVGKPNHESLIKLAKDYHNNVCEGDECIIYQKKVPFVKVSYDVVGGVVNFSNLDNLNDKFYVTGGVLFYFTMPRSNEKIFLKAGLLLSKLENLDGDKYIYVNVPIHIGYMAPKAYKVRPFVSIGLFSPSYSGGLMIKIDKKISVGVHANARFSPAKFPLAPKELYNYSFLTSIYIDL